MVLPQSHPSPTALCTDDDARDSEIHVILEVRDDSRTVPLYDYRRVIVSVGRP
jgi:hypothetical protein